MPESIDQSESPFLNVGSFEIAPAAGIKRLGLASPFVEAFALEHGGQADGSNDGARRILLAELYDDELDDAVYELLGDTAGFVGNGAGRLGVAALRLRFAPLADELERYVDRAAGAFGSRDAANITEPEIDEVLGRIEPERSFAPEFEQLFGSLKKAISRAAKGAVSLAKKGIQAATQLGLGPILAKLKGLIRPLLDRVLKAAINRLPAAVQPAARTLAGKLPALFGGELEAGEDDRAVDVSAIQQEFNEQVADVLLGEAGVELEAEHWPEPDQPSEAAAIGDLDSAREQFTTQLEQLESGGDVEPAVERFVPALLPALKLGIRLAGRKRVVRLLSGLVARLIARFVGPASTGALSTALVDAGLKLIGLEVSPEDQRRTARAALTATVEETVRRVAALPDAVLDNEALLEASVVQAFEESAASNLPPVLPDAVYRARPELAETDSRRGTWLPLPIRGPKRYKKFSRVIRTRITPRMAMAVTTFGDAPLAQYLQEQVGLEPGEEIEADVHLYETLPGTLLGEVARLEANGDGAARTIEFHPLTREASALLLREPGLGRDASAASLGGPQHLAVGQRFFRMSIPGRRLTAATVPGARGRARRRTSLHALFDFPGDAIRLTLFLSERKAQELAAALRKGGHAGAIATRLKQYIDRALASAMDGRMSGRVRILHEALTLEEARGAALGRIPRPAVRALAARVSDWTLTALTDYLTTQSARFIASTEDAKDGITLVITLANPPGMAALRSTVAGTAPAGSPPPAGAPASVRVDVFAGFTHG
jgi:hypothetical protein